MKVYSSWYSRLVAIIQATIPIILEPPFFTWLTAKGQLSWIFRQHAKLDDISKTYSAFEVALAAQLGLAPHGQWQVESAYLEW